MYASVSETANFLGYRTANIFKSDLTALAILVMKQSVFANNIIDIFMVISDIMVILT
jgi:hypothetical protein